MKFYTFGNRENPAILLLPGTCCHWKRNFGAVIPLLERDFYVICASYDGFDETENTVFPDMLAETEKIEAYLRSDFGGHIHAAYGCSMGGSFVGLLVQRGRVHMDHAILGSSDLDQETGASARFKAWLIAKVLDGVFQTGKLPHFVQRRLDKKTPEARAYMEKMLAMFGVGCRDLAFVKRQSIRNQFYSDLITPLDMDIAVPGTRVHIFYAVKMGTQYEERYRLHFRDPDIRRYDLQHEELLARYPERWTEEIRQCCDMGKRMDQ